MVVTIPDGKDSAGRQKLRLLAPEELATRAFKTARLLFLEASSRKLIHYTCNINDFEIKEAKDEL